MSRKRETAEQLRARIVDALMRDVGVSDRMAQPFVESVMGCFAGERPYFPAHERHYPALQIRAALESGVPVKQVMRDYELSRSMLHKMFPGGLPKALKSRNSTVLSKVATK